SIFHLVVKKQWKQYVTLVALLLITILIIVGVQASSNQLFKMPIAVQDLDESQSSKELVHTLEQTKYLEVITLPKNEAYIEDVIQKKQAIV
ncbi:ABC transporter permease, partial [Mammaliicoccus sciuri]|nr:ABC transporter permease [Mammaliicoccus sciuri]